MSPNPRPLEPGTVLSERFQIRTTLGRGGFGIAYLAIDQDQGDRVVIKELAPDGVKRGDDGRLLMPDDRGESLRERFLNEAGLLSQFKLQGIPSIRMTFRENGTAYFATDYIADAKTLEEVIRQRGQLDGHSVKQILFEILDILEKVHARQILHRDIKPSNILLSPSSGAWLIDFGSAREWDADRSSRHTVLFTPSYAPPEQLTERMVRGPATDIYALCATAFEMLTGGPPPTVAEQSAGTNLPILTDLRPDIDRRLANAIQSGLALGYYQRPQSIAAFRNSIQEVQEVTELVLLDVKLLRLAQFRFDRRSCPACSGLLIDVRPLKRGACLVCRTGLIKHRDIIERLCPQCRNGVLRKVDNKSPLSICPICGNGLLSYKRKSLLSTDQSVTCGSCESRFDLRGKKMALLAGEVAEFRDLESWRIQSGRAEVIQKCDDCEAQFDVLPNGKWLSHAPSGSFKNVAYFPQEWARIALGLAPGAGNGYCNSCASEYFIDAQTITLVDFTEDPFGFAVDHLGRLLDREHARWIAAGKSSPNAGVVCEDCATEFDRNGDFFCLITSRNEALSSHSGRMRTMEDWHRIAQDLPTLDQEEAFSAQVEQTIKEAFCRGEFGMDDANVILWKGVARNEDDPNATTIVISKSEVIYGKLLKKRRFPTQAIVDAWGQKDTIFLQVSGQRDPMQFWIEPKTLTVTLNSGARTLELTAKDLVARLKSEIAK